VTPSTALLRTTLADPRPAIGMLLGQSVAVVALASVLEGTVDVVSGAVVPVDVLETILVLTVAVAVAASFLTSRAFAAALQPERARLHVLGAPALAPLFGVTSAATAVACGLAIAWATAPHLGGLWAFRLAQLSSAPGRVEDAGGLMWLVSSGLFVPSVLGWCADGTRSRRSRARAQIVTAALIAGLFILPTVLAVVFTPAFVHGAQSAGEDVAAHRLSTLGSASAITVFSASAMGLITAVMIASRTVVSRSLRLIAVCVGRGPLNAAVSTRLAARRAARFGPIATIGVGVTGLVTAQGLTSALTSPASSSAAADWSELAVTLGPALVAAAAAAVGAALAQARGTGDDLRALALIGFSRSARTTVVLVTALLLGSVGSLVGAVAALSAFLLSTPFGGDLSSMHLSELAVPITVAGCTTAVTAVVFLVSEWTGHRLGVRTRRR